jgi:branched-chain amino acid transport system permease protein
MPAAGAIARTATNVKSGGRTPVAGIVHALTLLGITLFLGRWATLVPMAVLAAILVTVAYHKSEWRTFLVELRAPRSDVAVLLVTFGLTVIVESVIQSIWTADFRRLDSIYGDAKFKIGILYVPVPELITLVLSLVLAFAIWGFLRYTDLGRALRATAEDGPIAAAFGVNQKALALLLAGTCAALAGVAGVCIALSYTLAPAQIYAWIGVIFAVVMMGGPGRALGPLVAGIVIGVSEAVTMAVTAPSWAPVVSFSLLILLLVLRPGKA